VNDFHFKVRYTEDLSSAGVYSIRYIVSFSNYPSGPSLEQTLPFIITIDPCKSTTISFIDPVPYVSKTYYLKDPSFEFYKDPETFLVKDAIFDCGPYKINFFNNGDSSPVDSTIFDVHSFSFKIKYTENYSLEGDYNIGYKVSFTNYPNGPVIKQAVPFTITIADACKSTTLSFINPEVPYVSKTYYLNDPAFEFYKAPEKFIKKLQLS